MQCTEMSNGHIVLTKLTITIDKVTDVWTNTRLDRHEDRALEPAGERGREGGREVGVVSHG